MRTHSCKRRRCSATAKARVRLVPPIRALTLPAEHATAADLLSRALFAYERAFSGSFNLTAGTHRLDFDRVENRVFYLALARNVMCAPRPSRWRSRIDPPAAT